MVNEVKEPQQDVPVEKKEPEVKTIDVAIPTKPAITVDAQVSSQQTPMATQDIKPSDQAQTQSVELFTTKPTDENVQNAQFSQAAAPPSPPYTPNTLTGQVLDSTGKIVEGAILEIKDASGRPARAVRTNRAGHFLITIPFTNGTYEIVTEKDGLHFKSVKFEAKGEIIPAIIIKGEEEKSKEIYS
jgi:protocatechuate 3,4-dioxygenase beta subunit